MTRKYNLSAGSREDFGEARGKRHFDKREKDMKKFLTGTLAAAGIAAFATSALAEGNLAATPSTPVQLDIIGTDAIASTDSIDIETGVYYRLTVTADGAAEVLFTSPDLFNNVWINQIVVAGAEIKMWGDGFKGLEVGEEGPNEVTITFVAIKPGDYTFYLNGEESGAFHVR